MSWARDIKNNQACATFVKYIALEQCQALADVLLHGKFYSIQANGSTNSANIVYLVVYVDPYASNRKVHVCNKFFIVQIPESGDAKGLFECYE